MVSQITKFSSSIVDVQPSDKNMKNVSLIFSNREIVAGIQVDCLRKETSELIGMPCHVIHDTQTNILQIFSKGENEVNYNDTIYNTARTRAANLGAFEISELLKKIARENDPELVAKIKALPPAISYYYCEKHTPPFSAAEKRHIEVCSSLSYIWENKKDDYAFRKAIQYINELVAATDSSLNPSEARVTETYEHLNEYLDEKDVIKKIDAIRRHVFGKIKPEVVSNSQRKIVNERRESYAGSSNMKEDEYTVIWVILPLLREFNEVIHGRKIIED